MAANISGLTVVSQFSASLAGTLHGKARTIATGRTLQYNFGVGAAAMQCNWEYDDESGALAAGASVNIDLTTLVDDVSQGVIATASLKIIRLVNTSTNAATILRLGNAAANAIVGPFQVATGTIDAYSAGGVGAANLPGEVLFVNPTAAGWTIDATHKVLKILNLDGVNAASYYIYLAGS